MSDETTTAVAPVTTTPKAVGPRGVEVTSIDDLKALAQTVISSRLAPAGVETPAQAFIAIQTGLEAGFTPMQGLRAVAVIGNRPSWLGKAALALVRQRGMLKQSPTRKYEGGFDESKKGLARYADDYTCTVTVWRQGDPEPHSFEYSVDDAKMAGLWNPGNNRKPWATAPKRMLYWRAIGQAMDELFSDVLLGLPLFENAQDFADERGFDHARVVNPAERGAATEEEAADPLLAHFEKVVAGEKVEETDAEALGLEVVDEEPGEETDNSRVVEAEAQPPECEHDWIFEGNPKEDAEPTIVCRLCGVFSDQEEEKGQ